MKITYQEDIGEDGEPVLAPEIPPCLSVELQRSLQRSAFGGASNP